MAPAFATKEPEAVARGNKEGISSIRSDDFTDFFFKPEEFISYLDQFIVKQDKAKAVLSTKLATHFNRIAMERRGALSHASSIGRIKNNILLIGPTGVGKTYMVKLLAERLGVPFVKGDATKFSETGYVGGDVEDLVRELVREADNDISNAECGIIYIDEIDKIASSRNHRGADISRTGVQRALLKPMEETDVDLQPPHDPLSMMEALAEYQKTGIREKKIINTRNILFIVSGAFNGIEDLILKRLKHDQIGFNAVSKNKMDESNLMDQISSEDLIEFGFESEFIGRLPVRAVLEPLLQEDLFFILKNPNNPVLLGKKADFRSYGINILFEDEVLKYLASIAASEKTGARGLVNAVENALIPYERILPSLNVKKFPFTLDAIKNCEHILESMDQEEILKYEAKYEELKFTHLSVMEEFISDKTCDMELDRYGLLSSFSNIIARHYFKHIETVHDAVSEVQYAFMMFDRDFQKIKDHVFDPGSFEMKFSYDALVHIIDSYLFDFNLYTDIKEALEENFYPGLILVHERTGEKIFKLSKEDLKNPELYISRMLKDLKNL